ncbi:MAG: RIP metalloprotease RseP [SAR202 cluster bacterium Io17-Chloro-G7]|nr:MAG: RIP metalloprotease RseP [SAR202 cluster bacterium Io17-Chloro-G7]
MEAVLIAVGTLVPMLLILVVIHELGHFFTARALGVKVLEFGVGFPPRAFGIYTGKTRVLIDPYTRFVNLGGLSDLRLGQKVKVYSSEDTHGNLVARIIEALGPKRPSLVARIFGGNKEIELPGYGPTSDESAVEDTSLQDQIDDSAYEGLLKHDGPVRAVEADGGSFLLADMMYSVNWAPLGGFVRLAGESDPEIPRSLASKGTGTRFLVLVAGPLMNAVLPVVILAILFMIPQDQVVGRVVISKVADGSAAQTAGVLSGDQILRAGGHSIDNRNDLTRSINLNGGDPMEWLVDRNGSQEVFRVRPRFEQPAGRWLTGISLGQDTGQLEVLQVFSGSPAEIAGLQAGDVLRRSGGQGITETSELIDAINDSQGAPMEWLVDRDGQEQVFSVAAEFNQEGAAMWLTGITTSLVDRSVVSRSDPPWVAIPQGFVSTWESMVLMKQAITGSVSSGSAPEFSGPIGIAQITGEVTRQGGIHGWLAIAVLLSINLAILNILPIPMLDGGRLFFVVLEWLRRGKRVPPEREGLVHLVGFVLLISAILVISANDITRLVQGGSFLGG